MRFPLTRRSITTFRDHVIAVMCCVPCEQAWTEATTHPEFQAMAIDRHGEYRLRPPFASTSRRRRRTGTA
jgi:hypothetical protein